MSFSLLDEQNAPLKSAELLAHTRQTFGILPNLERVMAHSPALLQSYAALWESFSQSSLNQVEQQVVCLTVSTENQCHYCVPWHSLLARQAGMSASDLEALRKGSAPQDNRLAALFHFTKALIARGGLVLAAERQAFFDAGFSEQQALDVILGIGVKTLSNFTNGLAATPLDSAVSALAWKPALIVREEVKS